MKYRILKQKNGLYKVEEEHFFFWWFFPTWLVVWKDGESSVGYLNRTYWREWATQEEAEAWVEWAKAGRPNGDIVVKII